MLSKITKPEIIPDIQSDLFIGHENSHLTVGIIAIGDEITPGLENEFKGYALLRGNVYAREKNYMPLSELNFDGTETDSDDSRSVHFVVIENAVTSARVVGSMRLIIKTRQGETPLPIEEHYPEAFPMGPASTLSTEVSRLICRHENKAIQSSLKWPLFTAGVTHVMQHNLGPVYGAVEPSLEEGLRAAGVPIIILGEPKFVPEWDATKLPLRIDMQGLTQKIEDTQSSLFDAMQLAPKDFVYSGLMSDSSNRQGKG